ncbi:MAG: aspartate aminotransferase family protein [Candidatus Heimdallarchaeota archaeon]
MKSLINFREYLKFLSKNIKPQYPSLVKGEGIRVFDVNGKEYLDFSSQTLNLNLGHCHPRIINIVKKQLENIYYTSSRFLDEPTLLLAKKLIEISPLGLTRVNLKMTGGSEANECAIKMLRKYHGKKTIITTYHSFFGETFETMRCSGKYFDRSFIGSKNNYVYVCPPYCFRCPYREEPLDCSLLCAEQFRNLLYFRKDIAGIIIEPINVNSGVIIPPKRYLIEIRKICDENEIGLVFDEVQTAFRWTGEMFASNYFGVIPDIMTLGKGISGGFPLGATLFNERYDVLEYGEHEFTYGAHTISCAASLEIINILTENGFLYNVKRKGEYLRRRLLELKEDFESIIIDVRSIGLLAGIEIVNRKLAKDIYEKCLENGLILRLSDNFNGNTIIIKPPLIVSEEEINEAINIFQKIVKST